MNGSALLDGVLAGDWSPGVRELAREFRAAAAGITFHIPDRPFAQQWIGLDASFAEAYVAHYHAHDPWLIALQSREAVPEGSAYLGRELVDPNILGRNEVVQELHRQSGLGDLAGATLVTTGGCFVTIGMMRPFDDEPFDGDDREGLQRILHHWQRALRIQALRERADGAETFATLHVDACGRVVDLDANARALVARADGVALSQGRLRLLDSAAQRELVAAVRRSGRAYFNATRRSARRPYLVAVSTGPYGALVRIYDRDDIVEPPVDALRRWFGVTRAEAALMIELSHGSTPAELAEERGVTISTIRAQLRSIYAKTGTRRQAEVAALVARTGHLAPK